MYPKNAETRRLMANIISKAYDEPNGEYFTAFKENIFFNYSYRFQGMFFSYFRPWMNIDFLKSTVTMVAKAAYKLCLEEEDPAVALQKLNDWMTLHSWYHKDPDYYNSVNEGCIIICHEVTYGSMDIADNEYATEEE